MSKKYEIHSGRRIVSAQYSVSPLQAVVDYVHSYGVKDGEIRRLGVDSVSWGCAVQCRARCNRTALASDVAVASVLHAGR